MPQDHVTERHLSAFMAGIGPGGTLNDGVVGLARVLPREYVSPVLGRALELAETLEMQMADLHHRLSTTMEALVRQRAVARLLAAETVRRCPSEDEKVEAADVLVRRAMALELKDG
jgi:hypothetical protein